MDLNAYFQGHPPRCLAGFQVFPTELPGVVFDGHCEPTNAIFRLSCNCGRSQFVVIGYHWQNPDFNFIDVFLSPIVLRCVACDQLTELIDTDIHGHDGDQSASCTARGEGSRVEFRCPTCGPRPFQIIASFEYPQDLFDRACQEYRGRESDFFTWFSLLGICEGCQKTIEITDFECA